jgi:multiple sugar transport system substrate-binding protein
LKNTSAFISGLVVLVIVLSINSVGFAKTTITYWHTQTSTWAEALMNEVDLFNQSQNEIEVKALQIATTSAAQNQKLLTAIAGGSPPDLALIDRFTTASWAARDALTSLNYLVDMLGIKEEHFYPATWNEAVYQGKLWGLPLQTNTRVMYWSKAVYRDAGLDPEVGPKDWNDLDVLAEKLTVRGNDGRFERVGFVPWYNEGWLYTWGWLNGGEFYDIQNNKITTSHPRIVEALEWEKSYVDKYDGIDNIQGFVEGFGTDMNDPMIAGHIGLRVNTGGYLSVLRKYAPLDFEFGISRLPYPEGGKPGGWLGGFANVIPKGSKHPEEAAKFLAWLVSKEAQMRFAQATGNIPSLKEAAEDPGFTYDDNMRVVISDMNDAHYRPAIPVGDLLWDELRDAVNYVLYGQKTSIQALTDVDTKVQKALDRIMK